MQILNTPTCFWRRETVENVCFYMQIFKTFTCFLMAQISLKCLFLYTKFKHAHVFFWWLETHESVCFYMQILKRFRVFWWHKTHGSVCFCMQILNTLETNENFYANRKRVKPLASIFPWVLYVGFISSIFIYFICIYLFHLYICKHSWELEP